MILGKTESTETVAVESSKDSTENQPRIKVIIAQNQGNTSPESRYSYYINISFGTLLKSPCELEPQVTEGSYELVHI